MPLFNSKMELMEFAIPVYGKEVAESKVLATDLEVVVTNMLRGPAGRLRRARFFSDASGLTWMDKQAKKNRNHETKKKEKQNRARFFSDASGLTWMDKGANVAYIPILIFAYIQNVRSARPQSLWI